MSLSASIYIGIADGTSHGMGIAVLVQKKKDRPGKTLPRVRSVCPTHVHNTCPHAGPSYSTVAWTWRRALYFGNVFLDFLAIYFSIYLGSVFGSIFNSILDIYLDLAARIASARLPLGQARPYASATVHARAHVRIYSCTRTPRSAGS